MTNNQKSRFRCYKGQGCPVEASLELFGGKWKGMILYHLLDGALRFSDLKRRAGSISQRMLTKQLRELEACGLVHREVFPVVPPHVEYELTEVGYSLKPILELLKDWGRAYAIDILSWREDEV